MTNLLVWKRRFSLLKNCPSTNINGHAIATGITIISMCITQALGDGKATVRDKGEEESIVFWVIVIHAQFDT